MLGCLVFLPYLYSLSTSTYVYRQMLVFDLESIHIHVQYFFLVFDSSKFYMFFFTFIILCKGFAQMLNLSALADS